MPQPGAPIAAITGVTDRRFQKTIAAIQELRSLPLVADGQGGTYWDEHSLIFAEVDYYYPIGFGTFRKPRLLVRPLGTVTGSFDPAILPLISVEWNHAMRDEMV